MNKYQSPVILVTPVGDTDIITTSGDTPMVTLNGDEW